MKPGPKPKTNNNDQEPRRNLTPEEQAIASRVEAQDPFEHIREADLVDFSLAANPMDLHPIAKKLQDDHKYAFRLCTEDPKRVDQLTRAAQPPLKWGIVTRNSLPEMASEVDDLLGCVRVLDQLLLYKPWAHHAAVQREKQRLAGASDKRGSIESKHGEVTDQGEMFAKKSQLNESNPYKISGGDEVMASEEAISNDFGELVVDE